MIRIWFISVMTAFLIMDMVLRCKTRNGDYDISGITINGGLVVFGVMAIFEATEACK